GSRIDERVGAKVDEVEARIEDVDRAIVEVGGENKNALPIRSQSQPLVDCAVAGLIVPNHGAGLAQTGFHPAIVPSSVENRRVAGAVLRVKVMAKPDVVLLTTPLGVEIVFDGLPGGGGMMMSAASLSP